MASPQFVMGAHSSFSVMEGDCAPEYLEVWLAPLGAYTLLGLPPAELRGHTVDAGEVLGADGRRLAERVRQAPTWRQRFGLVDEFLAERLEEGPRPAPEVGWVWRRLDAGGAVDWGLLAAEAGYADQAHLVREFRRFTGMTPTGFAARTLAARRDGQGEVNSVQDAVLARS